MFIFKGVSYQSLCEETIDNHLREHLLDAFIAENLITIGLAVDNLYTENLMANNPSLYKRIKLVNLEGSRRLL